MNAICRRLCGLGVLLILLFGTGAVQAAAPQIASEIAGIELLPQFGNHGALFVFDFVGTVDGGSLKTGWGWIEVFHESPLPWDGGCVDITGGEGVLWVGWRRFRIDDIDGMLCRDSGDPANVFGVLASMDISKWWGGAAASHAFLGELNHNFFPPTITGGVVPTDD